MSKQLFALMFAVAFLAGCAAQPVVQAKEPPKVANLANPNADISAGAEAAIPNTGGAIRSWTNLSTGDVTRAESSMQAGSARLDGGDCYRLKPNRYGGLYAPAAIC